MTHAPGPGRQFRTLVACDAPVQIVGVVNAYGAMLADHSGFKALYLSGAGIANASYGLPDLGITTLNDVLEDVRRVTAITNKPLLVDIDTGFGSALNIARTIKEMINAGVAAVHIEDQAGAKRCGHRPNKSIVSTEEMVDRIKAAVDAKTDPDFVIMARTDAFANEGLAAAIERSLAYVNAGADMIFAEALNRLEDYAKLSQAVGVPVLANITEFGKTPLFTVNELRSVGVSMALYPQSAFRAMSAAALKVFEAILHEGTQKNVINLMQTRDDLYKHLDYMAYENKLDLLFKPSK